MASQADVQSREIDTRMQGFDQIVSVSQNNVNASFKYLFQNNDDLRKIKIEVERFDTTIEADMNPPTVEFIVNSEYHKVYFFLNFDTGTFEYPDEDDNMQTKPMDDWIFAFACNVDLTALDDEKVPPHIKDAINRPGSYSVSQLLLDFQTADITAFSQEKSSMPGLDEDSVEFLTVCINRYIRLLKEGDHNILGYAITVPDPDASESPTFPPTSLQFQTYAYRADGVESNEPDPYNQLLFLEMTEKRPFPSDILTWSGNWLIPNMAGTMAINKQSFWNRYLLPKLELINQKSVVRIVSVNMDKLDTTWDIDHVAQSYSWNDEVNGATFEYESSKSDSETDVQRHPGNPPVDEVLIYTGDGNSSVSNRVQWSPGSPTIQVKGRTIVRLGLFLRISYPPGDDVTAESFSEATVDWSFEMTLQSIHDGGLGVQVTVPMVQPLSESGGSINGKTKVDEHTNRAAETLLRNIQEHLQPNVWKEEIERDLNGQQHFVFPGGGAFDMKNPIFNEEGDLLVELTYKQE